MWDIRGNHIDFPASSDHHSNQSIKLVPWESDDDDVKLSELFRSCMSFLYGAHINGGEGEGEEGEYSISKTDTTFSLLTAVIAFT